MAKFTEDKIFEILENQGYTDYQCRTIYHEQHLYEYEDEEVTDERENEIIDKCDEWWDMEMTMEKCNGYGN